MYHAVWKLIALALVVGVGVVVVVQAQRGMLDSEVADEATAASPDGDDGPEAQVADLTDTDEPPLQGEPDPAGDDDSDGVPATARGRSAIGRPARSREPSDEEDVGTGIRKTAAIDSDPFDESDDAVEAAAKPNPASRAGASPSVAKKSAIDIVDIDAPRGRGAMLTLDEPDEVISRESARHADESAQTGSGPRLLGASDDEAPGRRSSASKKADPFEDDDSEGASDTEASPAALPKGAPGARQNAVARERFADDDDLDADDQPTVGRDTSRDSTPPRRSPIPRKIDAADESEMLELGDDSGRRPAELGPSIETDDADDQKPRSFDSRRIPERRDDRDSNLRDEGVAVDRPGFGERTPRSRAGNELEQPAPPRAPLPQLAIEKTAPPTAVLGQPMIYQIVVRNSGTVPAQQVVVEDLVPGSVKLDGTIPQAQLKNDRLIWKLGTLKAGQEKKIAVRVVPQSEGTIGTVATVNFSPVAQPPANADGPRLKFEVEAPRKAAVGTPVEFNFRVRNVGPVAATGVTIRDVLPAALRHTDGDDIEYVIGQLAAGKTREVKLVLTAAQAGPTVNRAVVVADGNVSEETEVQLDVVGPALSVARSGPKRLFPDKTGRYANTVTNLGASQVADVKIVEVIPAGLEFVEAADGGAYNAARRSVTWAIKALYPGESKTVKLVLRAAARGSQISVVRASDAGGASGETVGTTHVAGVPALSIEIGELSSLIEVGETIKVSVRIVNRGSDSAANVRASVAVPPGMQFVSASGPVDHRKVMVAGSGEGEQTAPNSAEIEFAPIRAIDPRADATFELTFKARHAGPARVQVQARCDQLTEPIRREEVTNVVTAEQ
jgi:uncharacterized repeat protein (TIGR01451 family)